MSKAAEIRLKTVFLTGAAHGIGLETARALVRRGHKVAMADIDGAAAVKAAQDLPTARGMSLDVRSPHEWKSALDECARTLGAPDCVINNAGVMHPGLVAAQTDDQIAQTLDTNLAGTISGCRAALTAFKARGSGHIVNVCSLASFVALKGQAVYAASKHAVRAFHAALAAEHEGTPIAFTIVHPGAIDTRLLRSLAADEASALAFASKLIPAARVGEAIAKVVETKPSEVFVFDGSVTGLKLGGLFPWLLKRGLKRAEKQGAAVMKTLRP